MSNIEKIKAEIERRKKICEGIFERESDTYYQGKAVAYGELLSFVNSLPEEKPSEELEEDALLLKRAWLTLDGFGHEELAGRLRQFAERKGLIWK